MQRLRVLILAGALAACGGAAEPTSTDSAGGAAATATPGPSTEAFASSDEPEPEPPGGEAAPPEERRKVVRGRPFTVLGSRALLPGEATLVDLDLTGSIGRRPIVIVYLRLTDEISQDVFLQMQDLAASVRGRVDVFGAVKLSPRMPLDAAAGRLASLGASIPVIVEQEGFELGEALDVTESPSIGLIDAKGVLRVADARSLKQVVSGTATLKDAIEHVAAGGPMPTIARLPRYYPVIELIGEKAPDFSLPLFMGTDSVRLSERVARGSGRLTALFFWHPTCKHCQTVIPNVMAGGRTYAKHLDLLSIVDLEDDEDAQHTRDAIEGHRIDFPVLQDEKRRIHTLYRVVSTPTMVFVKPDGTVDSAYYSGDVNYAPVILARIKAVLGAGAPAPASAAPGGASSP